VDIETVKLNASKQGIPLSQISVLYEGLTDDEKAIMRQQNLIAFESGDRVVGRFKSDGEAVFSSKITGCLSLGAS